MFANLKNKIREETGSDLSQLAPKLTGVVQQRVAAGLREMRNRGSTSSLSALEEEIMDGSEDGTDGMKMAAASLKSRGKDTDWKQQAEILICEKAVLEDEKTELVRRNLELMESLKELESYKKKAIQYQDDLDQLEGFQTQEMAKIKHLLLERDQQLTERDSSITKLQAEISRLRQCQEQLSNLQDELDAIRHSSEQQRQKLTAKLEETETDRRLLGEKLARADSLLAASTSDETLQGALAEAREATERRLEETRLELADVKSKWCSQVLSLETQLERLSLQAGEEGAERRRAEKQLSDLEQRLTTVIQERDQAMSQLEQAESTHAEALVIQGEKEATLLQMKKQIESLESEKSTLNARLGNLESLEIEHKNVKERCRELECNQRNVEEEDKIKSSLESLQSECLGLKNKVLLLEASQENQAALLKSVREKEESLTGERDSLLLRNASLSQQGELACKDLQDEICELRALLNRQKQESAKQIADLETQVEQAKQADLSSAVQSLEDQLMEKNKNIKMLQQRLTDMKKTLQRELKCPSQSVDGTASSSSNATNNASVEHTNSMDSVLLSEAVANSKPSDDINHAYLKHVLIKFLTSREYEAKHLTRAVATLLHFTPEEERLLRETLEWKMSWFGTKPNLGIGQTAKTIPPS